MQTRIVEANGVKQIEIDGTLFPPLAFRSFRPEERSVSDFYKAGTRLMSILMSGINCTVEIPYSQYGEIWTGHDEYDFDAIDRQIKLFIENAPEAYFNIMLQLDTRQWYLEQHPECVDTFYNLVIMAAYDKWRDHVVEYLENVIGYLEEKYGERIFAYSIFCGCSTEWYTNLLRWREPRAEITPHPLKEKAYREYTRNADAVLPDMDALTHTGHGVFRDPVEDREAISYWHFHHETIGEAIVWFAAQVKRILRRQKLVGLFYGYIYPLPNERLLLEGHMGYRRVHDCPDIDMIYAPASYQDRQLNGVSGFLNTVDSVMHHGKLQFQEIDHTTYIAPSVKNLDGGGDYKDSFETRMILRREFSMSMAKRVGMWWFDLFGRYYCSDDLMEEVRLHTAVRQRLAEVSMASNSEILVLTDPESMYHVSQLAKLNNDCLTLQYDALGRIGAPFDLHDLWNLERLDLSLYRLVICLNLFLLTDEQRRLLEERVKRDGRSILWVYAPGYLDGKGFSVERMSGVIGMTLAPEEAKKPQIILDGGGYGFQYPVEPLFCVQDPGADIWGRYEETGEAALAKKDCGEYTSYYSACAPIPAQVLRRVAREAGVHCYTDGGDPVYANSRLIGIHNVSGGPVRLRLRRDCSAEDLFDGGVLQSEGGVLAPEIPEGAVKLYLLSEPQVNIRNGGHA